MNKNNIDHLLFLSNGAFSVPGYRNAYEFTNTNESTILCHKNAQN